MAHSGAQSESVASHPTPSVSSPLAAWWVTAAGWLVPGLGYGLGRKWIRAGLVCVSVVAMFLLGIGMQGHLYSFNTSDLLSMLSWVGDICAGILYFGARFTGVGAAGPSSVTADYGTNFVIAAGLLNLLAASDARDVYLGKKK